MKKHPLQRLNEAISSDGLTAADTGGIVVYERNRSRRSKLRDLLRERQRRGPRRRPEPKHNRRGMLEPDTPDTRKGASNMSALQQLDQWSRDTIKASEVDTIRKAEGNAIDAARANVLAILEQNMAGGMPADKLLSLAQTTTAAVVDTLRKSGMWKGPDMDQDDKNGGGGAMDMNGLNDEGMKKMGKAYKKC